MRRQTVVWIALFGVCLGATVYEMPNAARVWRHSFGVFQSVGVDEKNVESAVPDRLIATDPEAGHILRYALKYRYKDPQIEDTAALAAQYPDNEFFLSQLAEGLTKTHGLTPQASLAVVDRLLTLNPDNAYYRYLRGWVLLRSPGGTERRRDALAEFEAGHRLPQFCPPYGKYWPRVERLFRKAGLDSWQRPRLSPFYRDLTSVLSGQADNPARFDAESFRRWADAACIIADRAVQSAYDPDGLSVTATLAKSVEEKRLRELDLSEDEAWESRFRLARALILANAWREQFDHDEELILSYAGWGVPAGLLSTILLAPLFHKYGRERREQKPARTAWMNEVVGATLLGVCTLLALVAAALASKGAGEFFSPLVLNAAWVLWWGHAVTLAFADSGTVKPGRNHDTWMTIAYGLLWLNGTLFLMAGSTGTAPTSGVTAEPQRLGVLVVWSVLCLLLWLAASDRQPVFGRVPHVRAMLLLISWAAALMVIHVLGTQWQRLDQLVVDPAAQSRPLPAATRETYERTILSADPPRYTKDPNALPEHAGYRASEDMKALLAQRQTEGRPLREDQLLLLLRQCGRDARPVLLGALARSKAYDVPAARAHWGDKTVKKSLERVFAEGMVALSRMRSAPQIDTKKEARWLRSLAYQAGVLACISDPAEAQGWLSRVAELIVQRVRREKKEPLLAERDQVSIAYQILRAMGNLPQAYAGQAVASYLQRTGFVDLLGEWGDHEISVLTDRLADGDRELAEQVLEVLAGQVETSSGADLRFRKANCATYLDAISSALTAESISQLLKQLHSEEGPLRAFVVGRLTNLGYEWSPTQVQKLRTDRVWMVRLNALFASGPDEIKTATSDENSIVRAVATMLTRAWQ